MRKNLVYSMLAVIGIFLSLTSCVEAKYKAVVEQVNKECPISIGVAGELVNVAFEDGNFIYNFNINESVSNIESLSNNPHLMKDALAAMLRNPNQDIKPMMDMIEEDKIGITINYVGNDSGKKASITFGYDDLMEAKNTEPTPDEILRTQVDLTNAGCPMPVEEGLVMTKLEIEGDYVVYYYSVDEDQLSISLLNQSKEILKDDLIASLKQLGDDPSAKLFINACKTSNKGVGYKYVGNTTQEECLVLIELSEFDF